MVLRLVDKDGEILKVACKQCITGHRAKDCDHGDRILIQTRPPGRPQMCPNCPTKAKYGGKRDPDCPKCSRYEWRYYVPGHGAPHRSRRTSKVKEPKPKIEEEKPLIIEDFRQYPNEAQAMIELGLEEPGTQDQDPAENTEGCPCTHSHGKPPEPKIQSKHKAPEPRTPQHSCCSGSSNGMSTPHNVPYAHLNNENMPAMTRQMSSWFGPSYDQVPMSNMQVPMGNFHQLPYSNHSYVESQASPMQAWSNQPINSTAYVPTALDTCRCPSTETCTCYGCGSHPYNMVTQNDVQTAIQHMQKEDEAFGYTAGFDQSVGFDMSPGFVHSGGFDNSAGFELVGGFDGHASE